MTLALFSKSALILLTTICLGIDSKQTVVVSNLQNKKGKLYIGWYNTPESFNGDDPVFRKAIDIDKVSEVSVPFDNVPDGTYGISIFLDENGNGKIDLNFLGAPKEKYGFSNNVLPLTRAANFEEASIEIEGKPKTISIRLK